MKGFVSLTIIAIVGVATIVLGGAGYSVYKYQEAQNGNSEHERDIEATQEDTYISPDKTGLQDSQSNPNEPASTDEVAAVTDHDSSCTLVAKVRLVNENGSDRKMITNTRLEDSAEHIFRLTESVIVPAGQTNFTETTVLADETDYQAGDVKEIFTIPGYADTPDYENFYAKLVSIQDTCWEDVNQAQATTKENDKAESVDSDIIARNIVANAENEPEEQDPNKPKKIEVNPSIAAIDEYLADPNLDNLGNFCEKAKDLEGLETWETLNDDRTMVVEEIMPLDQYVGLPCDIVLNEVLQETPDGVVRAGEAYRWDSYDERLLVQYDDNDTDRERELKIKYNDFVQNLKQYHLFAYQIYAFEEDATIKTIFINALSNESSSNYVTHWLSDDIVIPEKILLDIKQRF